MITPEGRAEILDFGLAKRLATDVDDTRTMNLNLTVSGMVMGTPNYLPPEVLLGEKADARSDVWARSRPSPTTMGGEVRAGIETMVAGKTPRGPR